MANRPSDFDITTPAGSSSPRSGDDELRKIKQYTRNGFNDLTAADGVGVERHHIRANQFTNSGASNLTTMTCSGTASFSGAVTYAANITVDTNVFHVDTTNNRVGVGTATPHQELTVAGTGNQTIAVHSTDSSESGLHITNSSTGTDYAADGAFIGITASGALTVDQQENNTLDLRTNGTTRMTVLANGKLQGSVTNSEIGIMRLESDADNPDPVIGDFAGNINIIAQY